jgi:release factor glutamine methyltransferase
VLDFEPTSALFVSDSDPLVFYRAIVNFASHHLKSGASLYLEINEFLGEQTLRLFNPELFTDLQLIKDMQGNDRFITSMKT